MCAEPRVDYEIDRVADDTTSRADFSHFFRRDDAFCSHHYALRRPNTPAFFGIGSMHDGVAERVCDRRMQEGDVGPQCRKNGRDLAVERIGDYRAVFIAPQAAA